MISWSEFAAIEPELAAFGRDRLAERPAYLATVRPDGYPRVHPVTPVIGHAGLFLFMEPTSPKGPDLRDRAVYSLHNGVPDNSGTGGEFHLSGHGREITEPAIRAAAIEACSYEPAERYVLFELLIAQARCNGYGDVELPAHRSWRAKA